MDAVSRSNAQDRVERYSEQIFLSRTLKERRWIIRNLLGKKATENDLKMSSVIE